MYLLIISLEVTPKEFYNDFYKLVPAHQSRESISRK